VVAHQPILKTVILSDREKAFIQAYLLHGNATLAVQEAGYKTKQPSRYASDLLSKEKIRSEISRLIEEREQAKIAKPTEIMQFYTSVMRGEVLDQFGIEASIDTRIKAANELAKHQIEIPLKLQQREMSNNIGSITLNFLPRQEDNG
jgi:phage terminase small subunit